MADLLADFAPEVDLNEEPAADPAPAAEPTPEPAATAPETPPAPEPEAKPQKLVPLEALHESRMKEREWRDKAAQIEREAQERFQKLEQRLEKLVNPPPPVPKFEDDPAGHLRHQVESTQAELAAVREQTAAQRAAQEQEQMIAQISRVTQAAEAEFAKANPDYLDAVKHLQQVADRNLEMMGVADPAARAEQIRKDALAMSAKALQMGKSPAEVAYQLAKNYGFKAAAPTPGADPSRKIQNIQEGQRTAAMPAGGTKPAGLSLAALEQMDDDEFNKLVEDDAAWKKLVRQMG